MIWTGPHVYQFTVLDSDRVVRGGTHCQGSRRFGGVLAGAKSMQVNHWQLAVGDWTLLLPVCAWTVLRVEVRMAAVREDRF